MSDYTRLGGTAATFDEMIRRFGVVTVMNADIYDYKGTLEGKSVSEFISGLGNKICHLDTLKIANVTEEGPTKTVTGGRYSNPLIKFGKSARLEMQDALGNIEAVDALCGGISEYSAASASATARVYTGLHFGEDYNGPKTIVGDSFFIDQKTGQQVKVKIVFYQFLPDSIFNLTQDAEGDATVFDMNGDLLTTEVKIPNAGGTLEAHGLFYSILPVVAE